MGAQENFFHIHVKDKTGRTVQTKTTRGFLNEKKEWLWERPAGSGYFYYDNGTLAKSPEAAPVAEAPKAAASTETLKTIKGK